MRPAAVWHGVRTRSNVTACCGRGRPTCCADWPFARHGKLPGPGEAECAQPGGKSQLSLLFLTQVLTASKHGAVPTRAWPTMMRIIKSQTHGSVPCPGGRYCEVSAVARRRPRIVACMSRGRRWATSRVCLHKLCTARPFVPFLSAHATRMCHCVYRLFVCAYTCAIGTTTTAERNQHKSTCTIACVQLAARRLHRWGRACVRACVHACVFTCVCNCACI